MSNENIYIELYTTILTSSYFRKIKIRRNEIQLKSDDLNHNQE